MFGVIVLISGRPRHTPQDTDTGLLSWIGTFSFAALFASKRNELALRSTCGTLRRGSDRKGIVPARCGSLVIREPAGGLQMGVILAPPDAVQLAQVISQATAPAFMLGAVAGFVSILLGRMNAIVDRIRHLNEIDDADGSRSHLKADVPRLRKRLRLLSDATRLILASGMCTALLLCVGFGSAFLHLQHVYGAGVLFFMAVVLMGIALVKFGQEVTIGISEADHYR